MAKYVLMTFKRVWCQGLIPVSNIQSHHNHIAMKLFSTYELMRTWCVARLCVLPPLVVYVCRVRVFVCLVNWSDCIAMPCNQPICTIITQSVSHHTSDKQSSRNEFLIKYSYAIYSNAFSLKCNVYVMSICVLGIITVWLWDVYRNVAWNRCFALPTAATSATTCTAIAANAFQYIYWVLRLSMPNIQNEILIGFVTCPPMVTASIWHISSHEYASSKNKSIPAHGQWWTKHKNVDIWNFVWIQLHSHSLKPTQTQQKIYSILGEYS